MSGMQNTNVPIGNSTRQDESLGMKPSVDSRNMQTNMLKSTSTIQKHKQTSTDIYCIGDAQFQLEYNTINDNWSIRRYLDTEDPSE